MPTFPRIIPLSGTDLQRQFIQSHGRLLANELHTTSDQKRVFLEGTIVAPVFHGADLSVGDEATMLALHETSDRSVHPFDMCFRTDIGDTGAVFVCISNRGETIDDWLQFPVGGGSSDDGVIDGGDASSALTDVIDGGGSYEPSIEIEGTPPL